MDKHETNGRRGSVRRMLAATLCAVLLCAGCTGGGGGAGGFLGRREPVTLSLGIQQGGDQSAQLARLQEILDEAGWRITVEMPNTGYDGSLAFYLDTLKEAFASPGQMAVVDRDAYEALRGEDLLGDIAATAAELAPAFLADAVESVSDPVPYEEWEDRIPLMRAEPGYIRHTMLLVRREVQDSFGREVKTPDDYLELLQYAAAHFPDYTPGCVTPQYYFGDYLHLYNLYLSQFGLIPEYTTHNFAIEANGDMIALENTNYTQGFLEWMGALGPRYGVEFLSLNGNSYTLDAAKYATVLCDGEMFYENSPRQEGSPDTTPDFRDFYVSVPTAGHILTREATPYYLVMSKDTNPAEALNFLERLTGDEALYRAVMLGGECAAGLGRPGQPCHGRP